MGGGVGPTTNGKRIHEWGTMGKERRTIDDGRPTTRDHLYFVAHGFTRMGADSGGWFLPQIAQITQIFSDRRCEGLVDAYEI